MFHYDNCIVRVYKPIITEEEKRRMERVKKAARDLMIEVLKNEERNSR